jgi:hypothetical protein
MGADDENETKTERAMKNTNTKRNHNVTMNEIVSAREDKFYAARARKIAAARAANKAAGFSERARRAIARADREFLLSVAGL